MRKLKSIERSGLNKVVFFSVILVFISACEKSDQRESDTTNILQNYSVSLGITNTPPSWLTHIAINQGFFKQQGLNVTTTVFKSGKRALKGMLKGKVEVSTTAVGPIVSSSLQGKDFSILATIGTSSNDNLIVARKDRGITLPAHLKAKKVATQSASAAHFYLHLFLLKQKLTENDILPSYMKVEKLPAAIVSGEVDAISTREPFYSEAMKKLGDNAVSFETPGLYLKSFQLVSGNDYIKQNPEVLNALMRGLILAEKFVKENKSRAIEILMSEVNLSRERVLSTFEYLDLSVVLDQSLILKLEDEARWVVQTRMKEKQVPNYLNYIHADSLKSVNEASVTIIK